MVFVYRVLVLFVNNNKKKLEIVDLKQKPSTGVEVVTADVFF